MKEVSMLSLTKISFDLLDLPLGKYFDDIYFSKYWTNFEYGIDSVSNTLPMKATFHITNILLYHSRKVCVSVTKGHKENSMMGASL